jgi:adenylate cyclase
MDLRHWLWRSPPGLDGAELARDVERRLAIFGGTANLIGASGVLVFLAYLAPSSLSDAQIEQLVEDLWPLFLAYMAVTLPLGYLLITRRPFRPVAEWLQSGEPADVAIQKRVLRYPRTWALGTAVPWTVGALLAFAVAAATDVGVAAAGALGIVAGGLTSVSLQYLVVEWIMRPVAARALAGGPPPATGATGVGVRSAMAWVFGSGVPMLGIVAFGAGDLAGADFDSGEVAIASLVLAAVGILNGAIATVIAARSVVDPLASMRGALERVERGELGTQVAVDDGSEVGLLEAGFNRMTRGLAERERLRDAFGAYVDPSLTERVIAEGTDLAGDQVDVSLLFMDVRGFTGYSEKLGPQEVVASLNALYERVVPIVTEHGGHANKFIGDGLLAVFGAPVRLEEHADQAVAAALEIGALNDSRHFSGLSVGVGVNSGEVVAGTVGGGGRLDFTVIGDAVNTAARVEAATRETGDNVLITAATHAQLRNDHGTWTERDPVELKGKSEPVRLYAPS